MKRILCFGDSNTYGYNPHNGNRYDKNTRWTGVLQKLAGENYEIVEAGGNNRTAFSDNPDGLQFTGYKLLPEYLKENYETIILAIGINDLQIFYNPAIEEFENGIRFFVSIAAEQARGSNLILLSPSHINENILKSNFRFLFDEISIEKSKKITLIYEKIAKEYNCKLLDLNKLVNTSKIDGLHYEAEEHKKIAESVIKLI